MKILVFLEKSELKHCGGPIGFWYNVLEEIKREHINTIDFLDDRPTTTPKNHGLFYYMRVFLRIFVFPSRKYSNLFSRYDAIHFQSVKTLYAERLALKDYKGIVLLTSHTPVPPQDEMIEEMQKNHPLLATRFLYRHFERMAEKAFLRADYFLFPCQEAEEPYFKYWKRYLKIHEKKKSSFLYIPTGIIGIQNTFNRELVRKEFRIPKDAFVACFIGRHNKVKGYDIFQEIVNSTLDDSAFFALIAGAKGPLPTPNHPHWVEAGWVDPSKVFCASDLFVLPNRDTFFDLVMIEALSSKKIVLASRTGGNLFYEKEKVPGIFLYSSLDEARLLLAQIRMMTKEKRKELGEANFEFFKTRLTTKQFLNQYLKTLELIVINRNK